MDRSLPVRVRLARVGRFAPDPCSTDSAMDALDLEVVPADAALVRRADELWTEDLADGSTLRGVRIVDPFR